MDKERECLVIDKLVDGEREVENEIDFANCLNRSFRKLDIQRTNCERSKFFPHRG